MAFLARVRVWLQKPWFVAVLALIAVLYVARNIVLPIMRLYGWSSPVASTAPARSGPVAAGAGSAGVMVSPVAGAASPAGTPAAALPEDLAAVRRRELGNLGLSRDPWLYANDPRQPGGRAQARPKTLVQVTGDAPRQPAPIPVRAADIGLRVGAVMSGPTGYSALINRRVVRPGDTVLAAPSPGQSPGEVAVTQEPVAYQVLRIEARLVDLRGPGGRLRVYLGGREPPADGTRE